MTIIDEIEIDEPATHVIVIGVGDYPHLLNGSGDQLVEEECEKMGQLTSPPHSARKFANWLIKDSANQLVKPLSSVELLISDANNNMYTHPKTKKSIKIDRANKENTTNAIFEWVNRAKRHQGGHEQSDLVIFYFCGHGLNTGGQWVLLLDDYGKNHRAKFSGAFDFNLFYHGMDQCDARLQLFFVDACRTFSDELLNLSSGVDPIIEGKKEFKFPRRYAPVYSASLPGSAAWGRKNKPAYFTEALIQSLRGAGSVKSKGKWIVYADTLNRGISYNLRRKSKRNQVTQVDKLIDGLQLIKIQGQPIIPVAIGCEPKEANAKATLTLSNNSGYKNSCSKITTAWDVEIPAGDYEFRATFEEIYRENHINQSVWPPGEEIIINTEVKQ